MVDARRARHFPEADQRCFAQLSGDHNPMHVDPLMSRRLPFGRCVVHGIHLLLWAIAESARGHQDAGRRNLKSVRVDFRRPVAVGENAELSLQTEGSKCTARWSSEGVPCGRTSFEWIPGASGSSLADRSVPELTCSTFADPGAFPAVGQVPLGLDEDLVERLFPSLMAQLDPDAIAALLGVSRLIGMVCPGERSLLTRAQLRATDGAGTDPSMRWEQAGYDERFSLLTLAVRTPALSGTVQSRFRALPVAQVSPMAVSDLVSPGEFSHVRALVVGGSRGLGEVAVKLLAGGGGEVDFTYHRGRQEAEDLTQQLHDAGTPVRANSMDVLAPHDAESRAFLTRYNRVYYFATPAIHVSQKGCFSDVLFQRFLAVYVEGFRRLLDVLPTHAEEVVGVYYPSSEAVDTVPANMGEYAAAKAAGEVVARHYQETHPQIVVSSRLPRLHTDQTASFGDAAPPPPEGIIIEQLRGLERACR